jgi:excisionase family DNA binding protein
VSFDEILSATVEAAVARAVEPLRREVAALRRDRPDSAPCTITEAARRLGVSTKTVRRRLAEGALQAVMVGRTRRVAMPERAM